MKWPGVTLAVAPSDRQCCDQPLYVAHSRFHRTGTLVGESRGRDLVIGSVLGRPGLAWSIVGDVCPETSRRLGGMRSLATACARCGRAVVGVCPCRPPWEGSTSPRTTRRWARLRAAKLRANPICETEGLHRAGDRGRPPLPVGRGSEPALRVVQLQLDVRPASSDQEHRRCAARQATAAMTPQGKGPSNLQPPPDRTARRWRFFCVHK